MKLDLLLATVLAVSSLAGCQSPVSDPQSVTNSGSSLPLGKGSGVTVYAATADGNGVLMYSSTATNWVTLDWSNYYSASNPYYSYTTSSGTITLVYPAVYDVTTDGSGTVYAATADGLIIGQGALCVRVLHGSSTYGTLNGVAVTSAGGIYVSTSNGLWYATASSNTSWTQLYSTGPVCQWVALGTTAGVACTSLGLYYSASPATAGSYSLAPSTGTALASSAPPNTASLSGSTLYVGSSAAFSDTSTSGTFNWTNNTKVGSGVNGILATTINSNPTLLVATTSGIKYTPTQSITSGTTWSPLTVGVGVYNIVEGSDTSTYYFSNGLGGLGILQIDSSGTVTPNAVLTWANVSKVFVTTP